MKRLTYVFAYFILTFSYVALKATVLSAMATRGFGYDALVVTAYGMFGLLLTVLGYISNLRRRDAGLGSGWLLAAIFIPFAWIILATRPGKVDQIAA